MIAPAVLFPELTAEERDSLVARARSTAAPVAPTSAAPDLSAVAELLAGTAVLPFETSTRALAAPALARIVTAVRGSQRVADPTGLSRRLLRACLARVQEVVLRTQTALLHERRGAVVGSTPEERFAAFEAWLDGEEGTQHYRAAFPVSVTAARTVSTAFADLVQEVLSRADADHDDLAHLGCGPDERIADIEAGAGDTHDGRSVVVVTFDSGARVVHKPRALGIDLAFLGLVERINDHRGDQVFRAPRVLDRGEYGWAEFVDTTPVRDTEGAYRAMGELLGLCHLLRATDLHVENVVMCDDRPVLVDLETLLNAIPPTQDARPSEIALAQSVTGTGLLPARMTAPGAGQGLDVGALGYTPGQASPFSTLVLRAPFTDQMRFELEHLPSSRPALLPTVDPADQVAWVRAGYRRFSTWALTEREVVATWIADLFQDVEIRFVPVDTQRYAQTLRLATHPDLHRDPDLHALALCRAAIFRTETPAPLLRSEHAQLSRRDVPRFHYRSGSTHLYDADGLRVPEVLATGPLDHVLAEFAALDPARVDREAWLIGLSHAGALAQRSRPTGFTFDGAPADAADDAALRELLGSLCQPMADAWIPGDGPHAPTWIGGRLSDQAFQYWTVDELRLDLYSGSCGVGLVLAGAASVLGEPQWRSRALAFFHRSAERLLDPDLSWRALEHGAFTGVESLATAADQVARITGDSELTDRSRRLWQRAVDALDGPAPAEVMTGSAGMLLALEASAVDDPTGTLPDLAHRVATRLLADVAAGDPAAAPDVRVQLFPGFAHGRAGVLAALARFAARSGDPRATAAVYRMVEQEIAAADPATAETSFAGAGTPEGRGWCHGAPGRLLALSIVRSALPATSALVDAPIAALTARVRATGFGGNTSLCHGDTGNLWVLADVARLSGDQPLAAEVEVARRRYAHTVLPTALDHLGRHTQAHALMVGTGGPAALLVDLLAPGRSRSPLWLG